MAAGDFTPSLLPNILIAIDEMWDNPRSRNELMWPIDSTLAVLQNQTVSWRDVLLDGRCIAVDGTWLKKCADTSRDCTDEDQMRVDCEIDGAEIESDSKQYQPNLCLEDDFTVWDDQCKDKFSFAEKMAYALAMLQVSILKKLNTKVIATLEANAQVNRHADTIGSISGTRVDIPANLWTPDLIADWHLATLMNDINNPIILSGSNFLNMLYNAEYEKLNADQKDRWAKLQSLGNWYFDPKNLDTTVGSKSTYIFDPGNIGFFAKNNYSNDQPINSLDKHNTHFFRMRLKDLTYRNNGQLVPVYLDVNWQRKCKIVDGFPKWGTSLIARLSGGLHFGPVDCQNGTGVIKYTRTAAEA